MRLFSRKTHYSGEMDFKLWFRRAGRRPVFHHPLPAAARTLILEPLFQATANIVYMDPSAPVPMRDFEPATLAGRFRQVMGAAGRVSPTHAIVILTGEGEACLSESDRDDLWRAYGVPVFEQVITAAGELVAWDCEAHAGLHLSRGAQASADRIVVGTCDCGAAGARVIGATVAPVLSGGLDLPALLLPTRIASRPRPIPT